MNIIAVFLGNLWTSHELGSCGPSVQLLCWQSSQ